MDLFYAFIGLLVNRIAIDGSLYTRLCFFPLSGYSCFVFMIITIPWLTNHNIVDIFYFLHPNRKWKIIAVFTLLPGKLMLHLPKLQNHTQNITLNYISRIQLIHLVSNFFKNNYLKVHCICSMP